MIHQLLKLWGASCPAGRELTQNDKSLPTMHVHEELMDLWGEKLISNQTLFKWYEDRYSTSKHLLTLYSWIRGTRAKHIVEIGFGRSSFVLARAACENGGQFTTVDKRDFSYLFSNEERKNSHLLLGYSDELWKSLEYKNQKIDFAFLDYFSDPKCSAAFCAKEISECIKHLAPGGSFAIHDSIEIIYPISQIVKKVAEENHLELITFPYNYGLSLFRIPGGSIQDSWLKK